MKNYLIIFFTSISLTGCSFLLGTKDLGDGYVLDDKLIVKSSAFIYDGVGSVVIPPTILKYSYNKNWILVLSQDMKNQDNYWIIDKYSEGTKIKTHKEDSLFWYYDIYSNVIGPIDSITFYKKIKEDKIDVSFD